jgi:beta-glucosidase
VRVVLSRVRKAVIVGLACALVAGPTPHRPAGAAGPIYLDQAYSPVERAADLVARLTLNEKASQMISSQSVAVPRLGIAAYGWWNEAAHGVAREGTLHDANPPTLVNTTSYPVDLSLGATWNPDLMYREATLISDEAREVVRENRLDLNFYSPTVNLARDPRWGRNDEAFSEDPYLTTALATQFVNGMEGKDRHGRPLTSGHGYLKTSTTIKHYAANNSEFNRRNGTSDMDDRTLREYYTRQFRDIVRLSQPASIMTSYNRVNGVPTTASVYLMDTLARQTFGFEGFFTSDCDSIQEIQNGHRWQPPGEPDPLDQVERHAWANSAGNDLNCQRGYRDDANYANTIPNAAAGGIATETGVYSVNDVDTALVRLFTVRIRLGEFDDQSRVPWVVRARAAVPEGTWTNTDANNAVTETPPRLAMAREVGAESIVLLRNDRVGAAPVLPLRVPASGPYRVAVIGHYADPATMFLGGYSSQQQAAGQARQVNGLAGIAAAVRAVNPDAVVDHLPGVTPRTLAEVDAASVEAAASYDAVVVYVGDDERHSREDVDRTSLALPGAQADLIRRVAARNPNTVVYVESVGQVDLGGVTDAVPAILWSSYNGQRKGEALADVLLGTRTPSGHLPFTWYADLADLPPIDDYRVRPGDGRAGRTYMYFRGPVTYPFGHGLSYTRFAYSPLRVDRTRVDANAGVQASVDVTNVGRVGGAEVVQLYAGTPDAPAAAERPVRRLVGFSKIVLRPGQTRRVHFALSLPDLAFFDDAADRYVVDPGRYVLSVGPSSADERGRATVRVTGRLRPVLAGATVKAQAEGDAAAGVANRVVFAPGTVVRPQLTVAMSDDTLYGYVTRGRGTPLPDGLSVRYRSNRPGVVAVDRRGVIRTVATGVATVTADVTYGGRRASIQFVVYVR